MVKSQLTGVTYYANSGSIEENDLEWTIVKLGKTIIEVFGSSPCKKG